MRLVQDIILQGIVLFQSLKCYDDEIPCKQANLLYTDLLVLDVVDDFPPVAGGASGSKFNMARQE